MENFYIYKYKGVQVKVDLNGVSLFKTNGEYKNSVRIGIENLINCVVERNHKLKGVYKGSTKKIEIDFNCGHETNGITPSNYINNGQGCPKCGKIASNKERKLRSGEEFVTLVKNNGHKLLSPYINNSTKCEIDFVCGHKSHWITPAHYKDGRGCPKCGAFNSNKDKYLKSKKEFEVLIKNNGHILLSEYKGDKERVEIDFNCGHKPNFTTPNRYKKGVGCPRCGILKKNEKIVLENKEEFELIVKSNGDKILSEYQNTNKKIKIHFKCGHIKWIKPSDYKRGRRCGLCSESKGEKIICEWLDSQNIEYVRQYRIGNDSKRFDIYISSFNLLCEVQGRQHYEEVSFFSYRTLEEEQKNDKYKMNLALSNGYKYMVVDYREHKPELTLERFIEQFTPYLEKK